MLWFFVGISLAALVVHGFLLLQLWSILTSLRNLVASLNADRQAMVEDRELLRTAAGQLKSWILTHECKTQEAVETVRAETEKQTQVLTERLEKATTKVVEKVEKVVDPLAKGDSTADCSPNALPVIRPAT